jgi:hypothetical protein
MLGGRRVPCTPPASAMRRRVCRVHTHTNNRQAPHARARTHQDDDAERALVRVLEDLGDVGALGLLRVAHEVLGRDDLAHAVCNHARVWEGGGGDDGEGVPMWCAGAAARRACVCVCVGGGGVGVGGGALWHRRHTLLAPTLANGKPLAMAADAASAVLPLPAGPSSSTDNSGVLALVCTCACGAGGDGAGGRTGVRCKNG